MEVCNCSMFCCTLLYVHSSITIILMGKRELIALLNLSSWCLVMVEWLFLAVPQGCLRFVIVVFPDHSHLLFFIQENKFRTALTKFRLSSYDLAIEHGRYESIPRNERIGKYCNQNMTENEYHFLLVCPLYRELRHIYIY